MFRWGFTLVGLFFLFIGSAQYFQFSKVSETLTEISVEDAVKGLSSAKERYVRILGEVQDGPSIYSTGVKVPLAASCDPVNVLKRSAPFQFSDDELGCQFEIVGELDGPSIEIVSEKRASISSDKTLGRRIFGVVAGSNLKVWVLSRYFTSGDLAEAAWRTSSSFRGTLTSFSDLNANRDDLTKDLSEVKKVFADEFLVEIPSDAFLLLDSDDPYSEKDIATWNYYLPIKNSDNTLFVLTNRNQKTPKLEGILEASPKELYQSFERVLKTTLPPIVGVVIQRSGAEENKAKLKSMKESFLMGGLLFGLGMVLMGIRRLFRRGR